MRERRRCVQEREYTCRLVATLLDKNICIDLASTAMSGVKGNVT